MSLVALFKYRNLDSTQDFNARFSKLIGKGFFDGGDIIPVALQLKIQIQPFKAMSYDGMVVYDTAATTLTLTAGQANYVVLRAMYVQADSPIVQWEILDSAAYNSDPNINNLILIAVITIPPLATSITTGMIDTTSAHFVDKLARSAFRGHITSTSLLPSANNRFGDFFIISDGTGDTPTIQAYNGVSFINITTAASVNNTLNLHRQNLFTDEIHLTDDQAAALIGTSGTPSVSNPYVTNSDPRLPSQDENDAQGGVENTIHDPRIVLPSTTNRFMTQSRQLAVPQEVGFGAAAGAVVTLDASVSGPIWVGLGNSDQTALQYFNLFNTDASIDQEYINSQGHAPKITNIYIGSSPLIPNSSHTYAPGFTTPTGFVYSGFVNLVLDTSILSVFNASDVNTITDTITHVGHGLLNNQKVRISSLGTLPLPLLFSTDYYIIFVDVDNYQLSSTSGGVAINLTTTGIGQFSIYDQLGCDTPFRLNYGKQFTLGQLPPDILLYRKPSDAQKDATIGLAGKVQQFPIVSNTDVVNLNPAVFDMYPDNAVLDVDVFENGVQLMPDDGYFKPITIVLGVNDALDFIDSTSTSYTVIVPAGVYTSIANLNALATNIGLLMDTASADFIEGSYDSTNYKFTFTNNTGNFDLLFNTGLNSEFSCATALGFDKLDLIGNTSYTSQNMIDRGYVGWYKTSTTQLRLVKPARTNGYITVKKLFSI